MFKYLKKKHVISSLFLITISLAAIVIVILLLNLFSRLEEGAVIPFIIVALLPAGLIIILAGVILWPAGNKAGSSVGKTPDGEPELRQPIIHDLQNEKKYFAGVLSHDLRSPLSSIILLASYLKSKNGHPETNQYIDLIEQSARKELEMMGTLLSLMRADLSKPENLEELNLKNIAGKIIDSSEAQLTRKLLKTHLDISPEASIVADPDAFSLILKNLVSQAICYADPEQSIKICSSEKQNVITIELSIQSHELPKIIDEDLLNSNRLTLQNAINGFPDCIDLYFIQKALSNYNGTIRVQADGNGPSCRFIMTLDRLTIPNIA